MTSNYKQICSYLFLITLGFIIFSLLIYLRFIRDRLPKDIPIFLTEHRFWILIYICCIYLFIIISLLRKEKKSNEIVIFIIEILYMPLTRLDHFIKYNEPIKNLIISL